MKLSTDLRKPRHSLCPFKRKGPEGTEPYFYIHQQKTSKRNKSEKCGSQPTRGKDTAGAEVRLLFTLLPKWLQMRKLRVQVTLQTKLPGDRGPSEPRAPKGLRLLPLPLRLSA